MKRLFTLLALGLIFGAMQLPKNASPKTSSCKIKCRQSYSYCTRNCQREFMGWSLLDSCINDCSKERKKCLQQCQE